MFFSFTIASIALLPNLDHVCPTFDCFTWLNVCKLNRMVKHMYIFTFMPGTWVYLYLELLVKMVYWWDTETMRVPCALFCAHVLHFTLTDNILNVILTHSEILPQQGYSWELLVGGVPPGSPNPDPTCISDQKMSFSTSVLRPDL